MERRDDPWADFLRRILISATLAGAATATAAEAADPPPAEIAEAEPQKPEGNVSSANS